jgi:hypothetical protein
MSSLSKALTLLLVGLVLLLAGCGSSSNPNPNHLTSTQASQLGSEVFTDIFNAISSGTDSGSDVRKSGWPALLAKNNKDHAYKQTPDASSSTFTYTCPDGGTIAISGSSGNNSISVTATPTSCSDGTLIFNGDPNITVKGTGNDNGTTTSISITVGGGVSFAPVTTGAFPTGSCKSNMQVSASVTDSSGSLASCSISGAICGYSMNQSCMPPS